MARASLNPQQLLALSIFEQGRFNDLEKISQIRAEKRPDLEAVVAVSAGHAASGDLRRLAREANVVADAFDLGRFVDTIDKLPYDQALWYFIDNVPPDARWRSDAYFHLRSTRLAAYSPVRAKCIFTIEDVLDRFDGTMAEAEDWLRANVSWIEDSLASTGNATIDTLLSLDGKLKEEGDD